MNDYKPTFGIKRNKKNKVIKGERGIGFKLTVDNNYDVATKNYVDKLDSTIRYSLTQQINKSRKDIEDKVEKVDSRLRYEASLRSSELAKTVLPLLVGPSVISVANTTGTTLILKELGSFSSLQVGVFPS